MSRDRFGKPCLGCFPKQQRPFSKMGWPELSIWRWWATPRSDSNQVRTIYHGFGPDGRGFSGVLLLTDLAAKRSRSRDLAAATAPVQGQEYRKEHSGFANPLQSRYVVMSLDCRSLDGTLLVLRCTLRGRACLPRRRCSGHIL